MFVGRVMNDFHFILNAPHTLENNEDPNEMLQNVAFY